MNSTAPAVDILMIGNFARDKLIVDGVEMLASGGGVYYGSVAVSYLGRSVAVVTRLHPDDFPHLEEMRRQGVQVFATPAQGTSGIANFYSSANMETRLCKPIGFGGKYNLNEIPDVQARVIYLSPLFAGEVDLAFLQAISQRAPVGMDIQGFVRVPVGDDLIFQPWVEMDEGLKCISYLKLDKAEAQFVTGCTDLGTAIEKLQDLGPREIVLTESAGVTVFSDGKSYFAPFISRSMAGRTGRGDTCFSTYIAIRLDQDAETACRWAAAVTSRKQEVPGPWKGNAADIEKELASEKKQ